MTWDPAQYLRFSDERGRPFRELVDRIAIDPDEVRTVVDLGCGPGNLTQTLLDRYPQANVTGVDNDPAMLNEATLRSGHRLRFNHDDVSTWSPTAPVDVIISNATLQWIVPHAPLLPGLLRQLRPGGWFAFQVPGNLDDPHHQAIRSIRQRSRWAEHPTLSELALRTHESLTAAQYLDVLAPFATHVDAWETTYQHILSGPDPVLEWVKGTALRPVLSRLETGEQAEFCSELAPLLRDAYPSRTWGTPFPFRRVFVVAQH